MSDHLLGKHAPIPATGWQRRILPLNEFRGTFTVECSGLQDADHGATDEG